MDDERDLKRQKGRAEDWPEPLVESNSRCRDGLGRWRPSPRWVSFGLELGGAERWTGTVSGGVRTGLGGRRPFLT